MEGGLAATLGWSGDVYIWKINVHYGVLCTLQSGETTWAGSRHSGGHPIISSDYMGCEILGPDSESIGGQDQFLDNVSFVLG